MALFFIYWTILLINLRLCHGLWCYECTSNDPLSQCVINNGRPVECSSKFCILSRIESDDGSIPFSFIRACTNLPNPPSVTSNFETHASKSYFRYCDTDWCNGGDGESEKNSERIIIVNGMENSAVKYSFVNIFLLVILCIYQIFL